MTSGYVHVLYVVMYPMRKILQELMDSNNLNGDDLHRLSGVSGPTTTRFLTGRIAEPKSGTVCRWAKVFGITEAQLRGLEPIDGILVESPGKAPIKLENVLTREELATIENMRALDKSTRQAWIEIGKQLCRTERTAEISAPKKPSGVSRKTRLTGVRYRNPKPTTEGGHLAKKA